MTATQDLDQIFSRSARAGVTIPSAWTTARAAVDALATAAAVARARAAAPQAGAASRVRTAEIVALAKAGKALPDVLGTAKAVVAVELEDHAATLAASVYAGAQALAQRELESAVRLGAEALIVEQLQPAMARLVAEAAPLVPQVTIDTSDPRAILRATPDEQEVLRKLDHHAGTLRALRSLQSSIDGLSRRARAGEPRGGNPSAYRWSKAPAKYRGADSDLVSRFIHALSEDCWVPTEAEERAWAREKRDEERALAPKPSVPSFAIS